MTKLILFFAVFDLLCNFAVAQDPAISWTAYAMGVYPSGTKITLAAAKWDVPDTPLFTGDSSFFAPGWFGIETSDNLNLIQSVSPWMFSTYTFYNEYYQWVPEQNVDSDTYSTQPGNTLSSVITYNVSTESYDMVFNDTSQKNSALKSSFKIQVDDHNNTKNYTIVYFVFENYMKCDYYPPNDMVVFYDITIEYDGMPVTPTWTTGIVGSGNCDLAAHIVSPDQIKITWTSTSPGAGYERREIQVN